MRISGREFFRAFCALFEDRLAIDGNDLVSRLRQKDGRTQWMKCFIGDLASRLGSGEVLCQKEFYNVDFCFWDSRDPWDKMRYRQPLYVLALIEHENGPNPEEEFWKLLHWYAPLKVVICYQSWAKLRPYLNSLRSLVGEFLPRSSEEEYLIIVGELKDASIEWAGWITTAKDADFTQV